MDEEFYFEESNPKKSIIKFFIILFVLLILFLCFMLFKYKRTFNVKNIKIEVGTILDNDVDKYITNEIVNRDDYTLYLGKIPTIDGKVSEVGTYDYKVKYKNIVKKGKIEVVDTKEPVVELTDLTIGVNESYLVDEFLTKCEDYSKPCKITYKNESDANKQDKAGTYNIKLVISDQYDNKIEKEAKLIVKENYSREDIKKNDLTVDHIEPSYDDWNKKLILSYSKAVNGDTLDDDERYAYLLDLLSEDLNSFLPEDKKDLQIVDSEVIFVYNKYNYVVGFSIRAKLSNGEYTYLTKNGE